MKNFTFKKMILTFSILSLVFSFSSLVFSLDEGFTEIEISGVPIQIHYLHSPPEQPFEPYVTLIFFHGMPVSNTVWYRIMARLKTLANVDSYAMSFPGFGGSDIPDPESFDYKETSMNQAPYKFADALGIQRFIPVVHDLGGVWTICPSLDQISRLDGLIAMNTPPPSSPELPFYPVPTIRILGELMANPNIPSSLIKKYIHDTLQAATVIDVDNFPGIIREIVQDNSDDPHRLAISTVIEEALDNPLGFGGICYQYFAALNIVGPLLVWGMDDPVEGLTGLGIFQQAWPSAQTVEVEEASHFLMFDQEQIVTAAIADYVNERIVSIQSSPKAPAIRPIGKLPAVWADIKSR